MLHAVKVRLHMTTALYSWVHPFMSSLKEAARALDFLDPRVGRFIGKATYWGEKIKMISIKILI